MSGAKCGKRDITSIFRKLRLTDSKRLDRRVTAVITYVHAYGELSHPVP